jgi:hypothetical protein
VGYLLHTQGTSPEAGRSAAWIYRNKSLSPSRDIKPRHSTLEPTSGLLAAPFAVERLMYFAEVFVGNVGIHLRRSNVCMTKESLHRTQVGAVF